MSYKTYYVNRLTGQPQKGCGFAVDNRFSSCGPPCKKRAKTIRLPDYRPHDKLALEECAPGAILVNERTKRGELPVFSYSQPVLKALLTLKNTNPGALSPSEREIADRVCMCSECAYLWVRSTKKIPERCPHCHRRNWDRPTLALLVAEDRNSTL